ncbi:uncharacterized protein LOC118647967 [Monomorium pharaonis]|uniref:uncharacterized protein LOC118647313 n=1 Tax=Monomorium pharaonis TaxID=307658 RepID=UPI0017472DFF|nr:uncharacterized protein LOC118647313 [Monomorium pharaonis]XP_036150004.1 uncharacterized protein LOC118647967 [Monomorium pharaonis]
MNTKTINENEESYICGKCMETVLFSYVAQHPCSINCEKIVIDDQGLFFAEPTENTSQECNISSDNIENINTNNVSTATRKTIKSAEERLIAEIQAREPLWNYTLPVQQRKKSIKDRLWEEVSVAMNRHYSVDEAKKKWKNLNDTYKRCLAVEKNRKSGSAAVKQSKWQYFDQMKFLMDIDLGFNGQNISNISDDTENNSIYDLESDSCESRDMANNKKPKIESALEKIANALASPIPRIEFPPAPPLLPPSSEPKEIDEIKGFTFFLEKKLRDMPKEKASRTMLNIHKLIFAVEYP